MDFVEFFTNWFGKNSTVSSTKAMRKSLDRKLNKELEIQNSKLKAADYELRKLQDERTRINKVIADIQSEKKLLGK